MAVPHRESTNSFLRFNPPPPSMGGPALGSLKRPRAPGENQGPGRIAPILGDMRETRPADAPPPRPLITDKMKAWRGENICPAPSMAVLTAFKENGPPPPPLLPSSFFYEPGCGPRPRGAPWGLGMKNPRTPPIPQKIPARARALPSRGRRETPCVGLGSKGQQKKKFWFGTSFLCPSCLGRA